MELCSLLGRKLISGFILLLTCVLCSRAQDETAAVLAIQELLQAGDLDTASRLLKDSLMKRPNEAGLLNLSGVLHAQRSEMALARKDFEKAVRFRPILTPAWQNLARTCQQLGDLSCAVAAWKRVLRAKTADPEAHESLALLYERQGQFAASLSELDAGRSDNLLIRCLDLSSLDRKAEARAVAARLASQTEFTEADLLSGQEVLDSPKSAAVVALLIEGLDARGAAGLPSLQRLVVAYEQLQRPADASRILERVAKLDPNNTAPLLELARLAESRKDYVGALGYLAHARDLQPGNARIHFLFGLVAGELNLPIEAKASLEKALAIEPENLNYNYAMGSVILMTRDAATASGYFQKFVRAKPADSRGHYALGLAHFAAGDYEHAKEQMKIAEADPSAAAAAEYYQGRIARLEGRPEQAITLLRKSISLMPGFSETHTELARVALQQGQANEAQAELDQALRLAPESFQANEQLLILYRRLHDARASQQAELLKKLDEDRSRRAELMLRTIEVRP